MIYTTPILLDTIVKYLNKRRTFRWKIITEFLDTSYIPFRSVSVPYRKGSKEIYTAIYERLHGSVGIRVFYVRKTLLLIFCARLKMIKNSIFNFHDFIAFK